MEKSIVCVHGRAQEWHLEDALQREWRDAIRLGIKRSQADPVALSDNQIVLAFYGDLFRPDANDMSKGIPLQADLAEADLNAAFEEGLADILIQEAENRGQIHRVNWEKAASAEEEGMVEKGLTAKIKPLLRLLDRLPGFSKFTLRFLVQDVDRYLHLPGLRMRVTDCIANQLKQQLEQGREIILIAHSLGTAVAYDVINTHPEISILSFITLGSPLGIQLFLLMKLGPSGPIFDHINGTQVV